LSKVAAVASFVVVLALHFVWTSSKLEPNSVWVDSVELQGEKVAGYHLYFQDGEYFLGLSYALAIAFSVFAISRVKIDRKKRILGAFGGASLSAGLYAFGCFLIGCCGSPMMIVYAGLFGSSFLGFTKPLIFLMTTVSIGLGYWRMTRNPKGKCCAVFD
jgi:hypothetical protein